MYLKSVDVISRKLSVSVHRYSNSGGIYTIRTLGTKDFLINGFG
jgi:hypothetical protein